MRANRASQKNKTQRPWRLMLWAILVSAACGLIGLGEIAEDALRIARNSMQPMAASGNIVFVGVDDKSLNEVGKWPWSRSTQAKMIDQATAAGANRVFIDLIYDSPGEPSEDAAFEDALRRSGRVTLADRDQTGTYNSLEQALPPLARFSKQADTASITVFYNWQSAVWKIPYGVNAERKPLKSFASKISGRDVPPTGSFRVDYRKDPKTVPYIPAADLLLGRAGDLSGKTIVIGLNADQLGDQFWIPGHGRMAGAYIHILGAETLMRGLPSDMGWIPALVLAMAISAAAISRRTQIKRIAILTSGTMLLLALSLVLERSLIFLDIAPALLALAIVAGAQVYSWMKAKSLVNEVTGLPNLQALRAVRDAATKTLVVARIHNHAEINAALLEHESREVSKQIVARLNAGGTIQLHQGEDVTFAWLAENAAAVGHHLEALHAMFRSPLAINGRHVDVALSFGVEIGSSRAIGSRLASAVLAADEAWNEGLRWKLHDPARQEEMDWRVSLLGELDTAIDNGEVWLAYQPQLDIAGNRIVGAEALARWTHPQKGPISPTEFIAAAEANGRIAKLTDYVLDRAISAAAGINRRGVDFQVAVNLSARLLTDRELLDRIKRMLKAHGLAPTKLTLELTETATLQDADSGLATLDALRRLGVRIAIDDYGTGLSTLDYLKKIPANEIKIDQSFVKSMRVTRSDYIMVQSTIALAHSLGRTVVAEGVEDRHCLEELTRMGCDVAQGFCIGRPMGVRELLHRLQMRTTRRVA